MELHCTREKALAGIPTSPLSPRGRLSWTFFLVTLFSGEANRGKKVFLFLCVPVPRGCLESDPALRGEGQISMPLSPPPAPQENFTGPQPLGSTPVESWETGKAPRFLSDP